jgi:hypothetical protein
MPESAPGFHSNPHTMCAVTACAVHMVGDNAHSRTPFFAPPRGDPAFTGWQSFCP